MSSLSSEYGVSEVTIYKWIKALTPISQEAGGLTPQDIAEIQKENLRLKQEIEILKKAMTIFSESNRDKENQVLTEKGGFKSGAELTWSWELWP